MHSVGESSSNVPAFLSKLWKLVEDPATDNLISWNSNGVSFTIRDQARFARELLPLYYKHNNMASFVRQLNMYGFHKVVSVDSGGLKLDKDEMEFAHTYFLQGHEYLLEHIKRKVPISKQEDAKPKPELITRILTEVRGMKGKQETVDSRLNSMKRENEALWREVAALRQKHMKQQQIVNKLIQFLISIVQPAGRTAGLGIKRRFPLMLGEAARTSSTDGKSSQVSGSGKTESNSSIDGDSSNVPTISILLNSGPVIHDVTGLIDEEDGTEGLIEIPLDAESNQEEPLIKESPLISEIFSPDEAILAEIPTDTSQLSNQDDPNSNLDEDELSMDQPDFNTMVQLEAGSSATAPSNTAGGSLIPPLSPDLLLTVDPRDVIVDADVSKENGNRGKAAAKKDMQLAIGETPCLESREELDHHLDTMQVDLDHLREVLSQQGSPLDASTLLGLFSTDDNLATNNYLSLDLDMFRTPSLGTITGNEVIAYNSPLFDMANEDGQILADENNLPSDLSVDSLLENDDVVVDKDTDDLLQLLHEPVSSTATTATTTTSTSSSTKRRKRN